MSKDEFLKKRMEESVSFALIEGFLQDEDKLSDVRRKAIAEQRQNILRAVDQGLVDHEKVNLWI